MSRVCDVCTRTNDFGNRRPFSLKATRCVRKANLQPFTIPSTDGKIRIKICTKCRRTISKAPRIRKCDAAKAAPIATTEEAEAVKAE